MKSEHRVTLCLCVWLQPSLHKLPQANSPFQSVFQTYIKKWQMQAFTQTWCMHTYYQLVNRTEAAVTFAPFIHKRSPYIQSTHVSLQAKLRIHAISCYTSWITHLHILNRTEHRCAFLKNKLTLDALQQNGFLCNHVMYDGRHGWPHLSCS